MSSLSSPWPMRDGETAFASSVFMASDGVPLDVACVGRRDGPVILLCNAIGMPLEFMRPLALKLAPHGRVVTWASRTLPSPEADGEADVSLSRQARDGLDLLDAVEATSAVVVGWCAGARIALRMNAQAPHRMRGLALLNGSYDLPGDPVTTFEKTMKVVMPRVARQQAYARVCHKIFMASEGHEDGGAGAEALLGATSDDLLSLIRTPYSTVERLAQYARLVTGLFSEPLGEDELGITVPALMLIGANDTTVHAQGSESLARRVYGAKLVRVEEADHYALYGHEGFQQHIVEFFTHITGDVA